MGVRIAVGKILQLALGAIIGAALAGIITGDENYIIVIGVGIPVLITVATIFGAGMSAMRKRAALSQPLTIPGINSTVTGVDPAKPQQAVLNPVSTAVPSAGVVLNGQTIAASPSAVAARPTVAAGGAGRTAWNLLSILTIAAGAALMLIPSYTTIGWIVQDIGEGRPFDGRDMTVGIHQQDAFDAIADVIGGTEVTAIHFYDSYISVSAPTSEGARTTDLFEFKYGRAYRVGPDYSQPDDIREELFDAGDIDMDLVGRLTQESLLDANLEGVDGVYPSITRWSGEPPEINITISGVYFTASYAYTLDGELIQRGGSAFE